MPTSRRRANSVFEVAPVWQALHTIDVGSASRMDKEDSPPVPWREIILGKILQRFSLLVL
jgi:hypothetical protein